MSETIGHPGRAETPVTRIAGDAETLIKYFDEQAALPGGDPIYNNYRALVDTLYAFDLAHDDFELEYSFFQVTPPAPHGAQGVAPDGTEFTIQTVDTDPLDDADAASLIDLIAAFMGASDEMNLSRVVGPDETSAAIAIPAYQDYTLRPKLSEIVLSAEADTDFFLIV